MITLAKTVTKPNFLFGKFPNYFKENDSYKDVNGEGLLERYLEIFCLEIDNKFSPSIDEVLDITNAEALSGLTRDNPTELLIYISALFGNPPDVGIGQSYSGGEDEYIILIRYITHILRTKGTKKSLEYFLAIYGYMIDTFTENEVTLTSYDEYPDPLLYDDGPLYDIGFTFYSGYDLVITDLPGTGSKNPPQAWLDNYLKPTIQNFINPIWAQLESLTYTT